MSNKIHEGLKQALKASWAVFPLAEAGKTPVYRGGCRDATRSVQRVSNHFQQHPNHNYGVATGKPSGIFVVDIDGPEGEASLRSLCAKNGLLPSTVVVLTAKGRHLYFKNNGLPIGNTAGKLGPGIDVRGDGGYVVGAGSVHPSGHIYRYADGHDPRSIQVAQSPAWLLELVRKPVPPKASSLTETANRPKSERDQRYGQAALHGELRRLANAPLHRRNNTRNHCTFKLGQLVALGDLDETEVIQRLTRGATEIGLESGEIQRTIQSGIEAGKRFPRHKTPPREKLLPKRADGSDGDPKTAELAELGCTDTDNATRLVKRHGDRLAFCPAYGWLYFDGKRWKPDTERKRVLAAMKTAQRIADEPAYLLDRTDQQQRVAHAKHSLSKAALDRMLDLAAVLMMVNVTKLDGDPWQLNVTNGTVDLRTGRLHRHDPRDMITMLAPVKYHARAKAPQFTKFMRRILNGDLELYRYLQRLVGYSLTGITTEQLFLYLRGPKQNGKSTLVNLIRDMLGDFGVHTPTETLLSKTYDNNIPNDLARLKGARIVTAIEAPPGRQLDEARIKAMTGGDPITARFMRAEFFTFAPEFKLWFVANDDPRVRSTDDALWRRMRVIPFDVVIPDNEVDPELPNKLRSEWPGILAWAMHGCLKWQRDGLHTPEIVETATSSYRKRADHVQRFLRECTIQEEHAETAARIVFQAYTDWCTENHERPLSTARFKRQLEDAGYEHARVKAGSVWRQIRLRR